ncbi:hypothetical protein niasHT_016969 [Heterodera trifolii]|uniref:BSD domain-containing protein n=1 Tax=Heterodera trifolii TaxID=157864 RepID=A0ABD2LAW4_9BILA
MPRPRLAQAKNATTKTAQSKNATTMTRSVMDELSADKEQMPSASTDADQQQQQRMTTERGNGEKNDHDNTSDTMRPSQIANRVFGIAKKASSKLQEKATNISAIVSERTIIGNIEKERQKFMEELRKEGKCVDEIGLDGLLADVEAQQHIIAISSNPRNFTDEPPLTFALDSDIALVKQYADALFRLDPRLAVLRFELVPKLVPEDKFWRNYAYRILLVRKFVAEKTTAEQQQQGSAKEEDKSKKCVQTEEKQQQQPQQQTTADATPENDEEEKLEKELLNDLHEFEMVVDDGKEDEEDSADNANDEDEQMGDELDKHLDELLDNNSSN